MRYPAAPFAMAVLLTALTLTACQPAGEQPHSATTAPATPSPDNTPALVEPLGGYRLLDVALGNILDDEGRVIAPQSRFSTTDTVYLSVVGSAASAELRLSAQWHAADGTSLAQSQHTLTPGPASIATFSLKHPEAWPTGHYRVTLAINGSVVDHRDFDIQ